MYSFTQPKLVCFEPSVFQSMQSLFIIVLREIKADGRKMHSIFFLFYKKAKIIFLLFMYTNKSRPFTIPIIFMTKRSCFHCWKGNKSSDCSSDACAHLSILPSQCSLFIIIIKNNRSNIWKKNTALFKYVVKSVFSVITVPP